MTEQIVNFERMEYALTLFGNSDENIRMLEQGYGVSVVFRGTDIKVSGDAEKVMTCTRCIEGLLKMVESGEELSAQNIRYMMSLVEEGREQEAEALGKDVICITAKGKPLKPKTLGQQKYVEAIRKNTITMGIGPAGTGKTYLAVAMAVKAFRAQEVNREIAKYVDVMIGNEEDFTACLGFEIEGNDKDLKSLNLEGYKRMVGEAAKTYPNFKAVATTLRTVKTATRNDWGAMCWCDGEVYLSQKYNDLEILDRVGGGDSFAAGFIYGLMTTQDAQRAVDYGAAHGALAMTTPGDTSMASKKEVEALMAGAGARAQR